MDSRIWIVAVWEFKRYFKWKSEVYSLLFMLTLALVAYGAQDFIKRLMSNDSVTIAIVEEHQNTR